MQVDNLGQEEDPSEYARVMARAFADYPVMVRAFGSSPGGVETWIFEMVLRSAQGRLASGIPVPVVRDSDRIVAAANLKLPGQEMLPEHTGWFEGFLESAGIGPDSFFPRFIAQTNTVKLPEGNAYLVMIGVKPEYQGRGVGRMLIQECADRARATGCSGIGLDTEDEKNVQIYRKCGFEVFAERQVDDLPIYVMWRQF